MKFPTSLRIAAVLGVFAFASSAQAQVNCDATSTSTSAGLGLAASGATPNCQLSTTASASVKHVLRLELDANTTSLGVSGTVDMAQFDSTIAAASDANKYPFNFGPTVSAKGNRPFEVKMHRAAANFSYSATGDATTYTGLGTPAKPGSDLNFAVQSDSTLLTTKLSAGFVSVPVSTSPAVIIDSATDGFYDKVGVQYRTAWNYDVDRPGSYSIGVVYTIVGK